jgi:hypothetical protein
MTRSLRRLTSRLGACVALGSAISCGWPTAGLAQATATVAAGTNFLQAADGRRLGAMGAGATVQLTGNASGAWSEVLLEGWIWTGSIRRTSREGFDLVVSVAGGENFRDAPSTQGAVLARLLQGFLLDRVGESGRWTQARRTGWVSTAALQSVTAAAGGVRDSEVDTGLAAGSGSPPPSADVPADERLVVGGAPARIFLSPEGDTVATAHTGADLAVLAREGAWARVRLNGWVRVADLLPADSSERSEVTAGDIKANPDEYRGRQVRWSVQFISLERAEAVRTDFYEGEPFILARAADPGDGFVYLAVPPELLASAEELQALETVEVLARVRAGRSAIMGSPVLDLLAFY